MRIAMKGWAVISFMLLLAACSGDKTSSYTTAHYDQMSQVQWVDMTSAQTASKVNSTSLIMMR